MPLVPKNIHSLVAYKAGRRIEDVARELGLSKIVKLASNENPFGPSPLAIEAAAGSLANVHRYPDPHSRDLREELCRRFQVKDENVITGSGSESIMAAIMRTFLLPSDEILSSANTFIGFKVLANASGRTEHWIPMRDHRYNLEAMADAINDYTKIIYIANPDNPTGSFVTIDEFDAFMDRVRARCLVILDEAYFEFAQHMPDYPDSMYYRYDNVITLRTFSKAHGLAGLRVGYGFAHGELIRNLYKVRLPFEPSVPAQAAALAALRDDAHLNKTIENNRVGLAFLKTELEGLGLRVLPSATNFIAFELHDDLHATRLNDALQRRGVIVRHLASFGWPAMIRVTVGLPEENEFFIEQLRDALRVS
ncbi:MAG: histidinol-phosphate transaminase [Polyangiaceae bacterium]|jgi:histidinol-phosphate aminotransferase|nr:histidinol-phosphate transaminase [Polyangiaceae bacterium]